MEELRKSPATWAVILTNVFLFFVVEITGGSQDIYHMLDWGAEYAPLVFEQGEYYRLFTCMFLHFGLQHLGNNMLLLYFVGGHLERAVGRVRFLLIYLLGGIGGSLLSYYAALRHQDFAVSAGASGAVFAVIGAMIWVLLLHRGRLAGITVRKMIIMAALALYFGFASSGVDNYAHVGGFCSGFLLSILLCHSTGRIRRKIVS